MKTAYRVEQSRIRSGNLSGKPPRICSRDMSGKPPRICSRDMWYWFLPLLGTAFCLWYIRVSTVDVIYSDYVRLVNSYLPDVWNPAKFFVPDVLTRVPANYLGRILNVSLFGFSLTFDRVLGCLGLGLSGLVLGQYCRRRRVSLLWFALLTVVMFSLNKWEMLVNGSGWTHFFAFAGFYYHYLVIDRVRSGHERKGDRTKLCYLPFAIVVLMAGPYCAIYSVTVILAYCFFLFVDGAGKKKAADRRYGLYGLCSLAALFLYLWSNSFAVEDHAADASVSLLTQLYDTPGFFVRFFVKSFSGMVVGGERAISIFQTNTPFMVLGLLVILAYLLALWLNWRFRLYEKSILPLLFIISGGLNHVLILVSRWIFLDESYGLSSRYALQFQAGIIGILLTFALIWRDRSSYARSETEKNAEKKKTYLVKGLALALCAMFLSGNVYTTYHELKKVPDRRGTLEIRRDLALDFENRTDDELREGFEYRQSRADSGQQVRKALTILKENGWNLFQ